MPAPETPEVLDEWLDRAHLVEQLLDQLPTRERKFVSMRFGLGSYEEHTYEEIGDAEGVTGDRVHQIVDKAIRKPQFNPKSKQAFYAAEFGVRYVHPDVIKQCDEIDAARAYIDAVYDVLVELREKIVDDRRTWLDAWLGFNGPTEQAGMQYSWTRAFDSELRELCLMLCEHSLLRAQLEREDARALMGFARTHSILHSHRLQIQELFWLHYRLSR